MFDIATISLKDRREIDITQIKSIIKIKKQNLNDYILNNNIFNEITIISKTFSFAFFRLFNI